MQKLESDDGKLMVVVMDSGAVTYLYETDDFSGSFGTFMEVGAPWQPRFEAMISAAGLMVARGQEIQHQPWVQDFVRTPEQVASLFVAVLKDWISPKDWRQMVGLNLAEPNPNVCHSHDFCDANMALHEAMQEAGLDYALGEMLPSGETIRFLNAVWDAARPQLRSPK